MIGDKVPEDEPAWEVLMTLKDVVELVMAPLHTDHTIGYMQSKISEQIFRSVPRGETETKTSLSRALSFAYNCLRATCTFLDYAI